MKPVERHRGPTGLRTPGPFITNRRCLPGRAPTEMLSRGTEQPTGPNHWASWPAPVKAR